LALYTTLASLSQTAASNVADGAVDAPSTIDQQTNLLASFIAQLRDGSGFTGIGQGRLIGLRVFTTSGTYTPTTGTTSIVVEVQGGGGAGGGAAVTGAAQCAAGSGGAAGGYAMKRITSSFSGVTMTVGAGGVGVAAGTGGSGGTTSFGALVSATGGSGATAGPALSNTATLPIIGARTGGAGSSGDLNITGGLGGYGLYAPSNTQVSGAGANSRFGFGGGPVSGDASGLAATGYGAAGSGGTVNFSNVTGAAGGSGSAGLIVVYEYA
jgi:hypothetical protein